MLLLYAHHFYEHVLKHTAFIMKPDSGIPVLSSLRHALWHAYIQVNEKKVHSPEFEHGSR